MLSRVGVNGGASSRLQGTSKVPARKVVMAGLPALLENAPQLHTVPINAQTRYLMHPAQPQIGTYIGTTNSFLTFKVIFARLDAVTKHPLPSDRPAFYERRLASMIRTHS